MLDLDDQAYQRLKTTIRDCTAADRSLLDELRAEIRSLTSRVINARDLNTISLVATDGNTSRLSFDPFEVQVIRVVNSQGRVLHLEAVTPHTDPAKLSAFHREQCTGLGHLMADLGVDELHHLSPMIPTPQQRVAGEIKPSWVQVYRDLCEWGELYALIVTHADRLHSPTLVLRDGLLRSKLFKFRDEQALFMEMTQRIEAAIERLRSERRIDVFLAGIARRSSVLDRYRLALALENTFPPGDPRFVQIDRDLEKKAVRWPEYTIGPEGNPQGGDTEKPKFVAGSMFLVRFGPDAASPIWTVDLLYGQRQQAPKVLGYLLADAEKGFPELYYPWSLQQAREHAEIADLDLSVLQGIIGDAVRELVEPERQDVFEALRFRQTHDFRGGR